MISLDKKILFLSSILIFAQSGANSQYPFQPQAILKNSVDKVEVSPDFIGQNTLSFSPSNQAKPLVSGAFGMGKNFYSYRAGYAISPLNMPKNWEKWDFYFEFAFYLLQRKIYNPKRLYIGSATPFVRYHFPNASYDPYWDVGLGVAYRDKKKFGNINISTNFCFHILAGLGIHPFGTEGPSISFRWYHFSNAKIKLPNNGIDVNFNIAIEQKL